MAVRCSLLVDIGATYIKVGVLRPDEGIVEERSFLFPAFLSLDGLYRMVDPGVVLAAVEDAIAAVMPAFGQPDQVLLSGQMHCWILTDEHNAPHTPLVTWQDNRALVKRNGIPLLDQLRDALPPEVWHAAGNELRSGLPVAGIYATDLSAIDGRFRLHSLLSWVAAMLTGEPAFAQHITDAAASGMFDLSAGSWSGQITDLVGGPRMLLPRVTFSPEVVGVHGATGADIFTPVGDQQAALLGAGICEGITAFNISTGGQVARVANAPAGSRSQTRPFFDGLLLHTKTHLPAGRALTHGVALLSRGRTDPEAWQWATEAASVPTSNLQLEAHPCFHTAIGGGWSGITDASTPEDLVRALVTAIAAPYVAAATDVGFQPIDELLFCGGVAQRFAPLRAAIQRRLGRPARIAPEGDMALRGLAHLVGQT
ncbi:FGGY family carbohydrate kinase [Mycobacterium asiaticum]|uniref:FGGY family carbohydrate kinase n=1 Tax=Mycobacterium asiaticum TaxID=1790 RepID=UPI0007EF9027|nr:FGGY family carbohydrate kinase [Mycobacterium asiaticum]OBJ55175.1 sugar kinase [Mycobacterium asiaticum]